MKTSNLILATATAIAIGGCSGMMPGMDSSAKPIAVAELKPTQGNDVVGTTSFTRKGDQILVNARVRGLSPGAHGFHIHEKGDCSAPDATSAGGHFDPHGKPHGGHDGMNRHAGDLGNLVANDEGVAQLNIAIPASSASLEKGADDSIIGRGLIVHGNADDLRTQPSGDSGPRVACGVISMG
jgi:Cu-Zn family superoxide dismutase